MTSHRVRENVRLCLTVVIATVLSACITEPELKRGGSILPRDRGDGWLISSPESEGVNEAILRRATDELYADASYRNALALVVVRNGALILEAYTTSELEASRIRNVQSVTKSVTSMVLGIVQADGSLSSVDQTLFSVLGDVVPSDNSKRGITLRHLLTMRSGIAFYNDRFAVETMIDRPRGQTAYILRKPMYDLPGETFEYRDADPQLISAAIESATGIPLTEIAGKRLFEPLGIQRYHWERNVDGITLGAFSLYLGARDLAKIGQLVLQKGRWGTKQVVPAEWITESTSPQTISNRSRRPYGFYWWIVPEVDAFTAVGHGGNFIFIAPNKDLVIVMTSLPHAVDDVGTTLDEFIPLARSIMEAVE